MTMVMMMIMMMMMKGVRRAWQAIVCGRPHCVLGKGAYCIRFVCSIIISLIQLNMQICLCKISSSCSSKFRKSVTVAKCWNYTCAGLVGPFVNCSKEPCFSLQIFSKKSQMSLNITNDITNHGILQTKSNIIKHCD